MPPDAEAAKVMKWRSSDVPDETMPDKKLYLEQHLDEVRTLLLESRGVLVHSASIVLPSNHLARSAARSWRARSLSGTATTAASTSRHS